MYSISAVAASKYYWMRYANARTTSIKVGETTVKIQDRDLFGIRELRNSDSDEILLPDGTRFKLLIQKSELLMKRSKEYRGKTPEILSKKSEPKAKPVKTPLLAPEKTPNDRVFAARLRKLGVSDVSAITLAQFKESLVGLDGAQQIAFKAWVLARLPRTSPKFQKIEAFSVGVAQRTTPEVTVVKRGRPSIKTTLTPTVASPVKVKLSEVELPELDDFTDSSVPDEFKRFARVSYNSVKKGTN